MHRAGLVLKGHEPYRALLVDRCWDLVSCNRAVPLLLQSLGLALDGSVNVLCEAMAASSGWGCATASPRRCLPRT